MQKLTVLSASAAILCSVIVTMAIVNPVWERLNLHVPGESGNKVNFTEPVDSVFYVRNAELGYRWINTPTSTWFHPLVSWGIDLLPPMMPANWRLWLFSLISGFGALVLLNQYIGEISTERLAPWWLLLVPLLPGGLGIATGNAEFPCLVFVSLLMLSVLQRQYWLLPVLWGTLAILTKPNAIYMVVGLGVYTVWARVHRESKVARNSTLGMFGIVGAWAIWVLYVDSQAGHFGTYWAAREITFPSPLTTGFLNFMQRTIEITVYGQNQGEALKYVTALAIPLVDIWILQVIPMKSEAHRLSILLTILSMLFIAMVTDNPNKVIVYSTTFPGHLAIGMLFIHQTLRYGHSVEATEQFVRFLAGVGYVAFCVLMLVFYVVGTPLMWYY